MSAGGVPVVGPVAVVEVPSVRQRFVGDVVRPATIEGDDIDLNGFTLAAGESIDATVIFDPSLTELVGGLAAFFYKLDRFGGFAKREEAFSGSWVVELS